MLWGKSFFFLRIHVQQIYMWQLFISITTKLKFVCQSLWFQLITLYPLLMPAKSTFTRCVPPLHEIADITQVSQGDAEKIKQYKMFLLSYLEDIRGTPDAHGCAVVSSLKFTSLQV